jgi:hypothetical protein
MQIEAFLNLLQQHTDKSLLFEYADGQLVKANYHITEVKHIHVDSVDCGSGTDSWTETVIQLWESPSEIGKTEYMTVYKALSILKKVGRMRNYDPSSETRIEYGNATFHTAQLFVYDFDTNEKQLIIKLAVAPTDCKAKDSCGVPETESEAVEVGGCEPGSGCC